MSDEPGWGRVAQLLTARRVELGYLRRAAFARANNLSHARTLSDIETARRTNYEPSTIAQVERLYRWAPGSIARVLAGDDPIPLPSESSPPVVDGTETVETHGEGGRVLLYYRVGFFDGLTDDEREEIVAAGRLAVLRAAREIRDRAE